jgi:hypothetical protein
MIDNAEIDVAKHLMPCPAPEGKGHPADPFSGG